MAGFSAKLQFLKRCELCQVTGLTKTARSSALLFTYEWKNISLPTRNTYKSVIPLYSIWVTSPQLSVSSVKKKYLRAQTYKLFHGVCCHLVPCYGKSFQWLILGSTPYLNILHLNAKSLSQLSLAVVNSE